MMYAPMGAFLLAIGALAGFMAGLLGIGGGLILVPGIYFGMGLLGYDSPHLMHIAIGTSLASILPTGLSSARAHWKRGTVDLVILRQIVPGTLCGSILGVLTAAQSSGEGLKFVFGFAVLLVAILMFIDPRRYQFMDGLPRQPWTFLVGVFIGILAALMGIAGALLCVPFLVLCKTPLHTAIGTSSAIGLSVSAPAAIGFLMIGFAEVTGVPFTFGYINLLAFAFIIPLSILMAPLGAKLSHSLNVNVLRRVFAVFMTIIAFKMLYSALAI